jgi:hypothetical protein
VAHAYIDTCMRRVMASEAFYSSDAAIQYTMETTTMATDVSFTFFEKRLMNVKMASTVHGKDVCVYTCVYEERLMNVKMASAVHDKDVCVYTCVYDKDVCVYTCVYE